MRSAESVFQRSPNIEQPMQGSPFYLEYPDSLENLLAKIFTTAGVSYPKFRAEL